MNYNQSWIGTTGEARFALEAIERGFTVLYPYGVRGYDCVVEWSGKFTRVQVKTTSVVDRGDRYKWKLRTSSIGADIFVFHVKNTDLFYMVHPEILNSRVNYKIPLRRINNDNLNNWEIFK